MQRNTKTIFAGLFLAVGIVLSVAKSAVAQNDLDFGMMDGGMFAGACCLIWLVMFIINILILIWVYKDAQKRGSNAVLWLVIVLFTGLIGLVIWLVVRPPIQPQYPGYGGQYGQQQYPPQQPPQYPPQGGYPPQYPPQQPPQYPPQGGYPPQ